MLPGTIIDERYEIVCTLGVGGFGAVYKAIHKQLERPVAIKTLNTTLLLEADGLIRFEREAQAINALKHKNIVGFYGYGKWQNAPYMVMEFVEGTSLHRVLGTEEVFEPSRAILIIKQVFEALACAHAAGVVHRDLKPANIMLVRTPQAADRVKIIDFGLAKLMPGYGVEGQKLTETGYAIGTCHYMAPEQSQGGHLDHRVDIYAAGCILYEMLAGRPPFDADNNIAIMWHHIKEPVPTLPNDVLKHPMGPGLTKLIQNCLVKDPDKRYQSCSEVLKNIDDVLSGKSDAVIPLAVHRRSKRTVSKPIVIAAFSTLVLSGALLAANHIRFTRSSVDVAREATATFETQTKTFDEKGKIDFTKVDSSRLMEALRLNAVDHQLAEEREAEVLDDLITIAEQQLWLARDDEKAKTALRLKYTPVIDRALFLHENSRDAQIDPTNLLLLLAESHRFKDTARVSKRILEAKRNWTFRVRNSAVEHLMVWYAANQDYSGAYDYATELAEAPGAPAGQRTLARRMVQHCAPLLKDTIEGESLPVLKMTGEGNVGIQPMERYEPGGHWSNGSQLWWNEPNIGDQLILEVPIEKDGLYEIFVTITRASDYGTVEFRLDDREPSPQIDAYNPTITNMMPRSIGIFDLKAGKHRVAINIVGANQASLGYMFGLDRITLVPKSN